MKDRLIRKSEAISQAVEKAHVMFKLFGWEYYDGKPSLARLEETVADLLKSAIENEEGFTETSTGRFTVGKSTEGEAVDYRIMLNLSSFYDYEDEDE